MMRKIFILPVLLLTSQFLSAQNAVSNSGFETWANIILIGSQPVGWGCVGCTEGNLSPFEGAKNCLITTQTYFDIQTQSNDTASGSLAIGVWGSTTPPLSLGEGFSDGRPATIDGQLKYTIYNGDTGLVCVWFTRWDGTQRIVLGESVNFVNGVQTSWEAFSYDINWNQLDLADPDSVQILFASSGAEVIEGQSYGNQTPGSSMEIDDVQLVAGTGNGVRSHAFNTGSTVFPNPASSQITLSYPYEADASIMIFSGSGQFITHRVLTSNALNISALSNGTFMYFLLNAEGILADRGTFEVLK